MDYEKLLSSVIQRVEDAGELLIAEWQRPNGPRGSVDKAEVDIEIESMLKPGLPRRRHPEPAGHRQTERHRARRLAQGYAGKTAHLAQQPDQ